jgi:hydantoinase/carbamoylase family amidase
VVEVDRERSAARIAREIETLSGPDFTTTSEAIRRYAYTPEYRRTLDHFTTALEALGFTVTEDPVGTLVARNRPPGEPAFGIGSHCDSNRNGGRYDGTLGVVTALEVCRLNEEHGLELPLQLISFLEEEGSGFGQMLLGSRIMLQRVSEDDLRERFRALDDGRSFWEHAETAGYEPARWRESIEVLDGLTGWIEMHIEQARVLQDTGKRIGVVNAIAGYVHADVVVTGRGDHAGATPMGLRLDPTTVLAETVLELERLATEAGGGTVGTVGEIEVDPGLINAVAAQARFSLDVRGPEDERFQDVATKAAAFALNAAERRGMSASYEERQTLPATALDRRIVDALEAAATEAGEPWTTMHSGAAHDTMCVAERVPSAMVFVPCKDGISHHPAEEADPADAALAAEIILNAVGDLQGD